MPDLDASQLMFSAGTDGDWTTKPSEVDAALDELANRINTIEPDAAFTDNRVLRADDTGGKYQDSLIEIDDGSRLATHIERVDRHCLID